MGVGGACNARPPSITVSAASPLGLKFSKRENLLVLQQQTMKRLLVLTSLRSVANTPVVDSLYKTVWFLDKKVWVRVQFVNLQYPCKIFCMTHTCWIKVISGKSLPAHISTVILFCVWRHTNVQHSTIQNGMSWAERPHCAGSVVSMRLFALFNTAVLTVHHSSGWVDCKNARAHTLRG